MAHALAVERAQQYRFRAEELRTIVASWLDPEMRASLEKIANDYDRMADHLERSVPAIVGEFN